MKLVPTCSNQFSNRSNSDPNSNSFHLHHIIYTCPQTGVRQSAVHVARLLPFVMWISVIDSGFCCMKYLLVVVVAVSSIGAENSPICDGNKLKFHLIKIISLS